MAKTEKIDIRVEAPIKIKLKKLADRAKRTLADYCRVVLEHHVEDSKKGEQ